MRSNSWNQWLSTFDPGERRYVECTIDDYANKMRTACAPRSRRPPELAGREFTAQLFTAVAANKVGEIRYLICVERIE